MRLHSASIPLGDTFQKDPRFPGIDHAYPSFSDLLTEVDNLTLSGGHRDSSMGEDALIPITPTDLLPL